MRSVQRALAVLVVLVAALAVAPSAFAQSSDLYPAGNVVSGGTLPIGPCTLRFGTFTIPTKGSSEAVKANFTTRPSIEKCSSGWTGETSGTWSISAQYGTGALTISIPPGGLKIELPHLVVKTNAGEEWKLAAVWHNGSTAYSVPSSIYVAQSALPKELTAGPSFFALSDVTQPSALPLLGP
jgi:hypothetical protein